MTDKPANDFKPGKDATTNSPELDRRINTFRETMKDVARKFARGAFPDNHSTWAIGSLLGAAVQIAMETNQMDFAVRSFAHMTGAGLTMTEGEPASAPTLATKH